MAHHGWTPAQFMQLTPGQVAAAWATMQVDAIEARKAAAVAARLAQTENSNFRKAMRDLET